MLQEQVDELVDAIDEMQREHCEKFSIKQAELKKKSLLERLEALQNDKTDDTITFEQLGVDRLYVDEAHYYKNLFTYTKMQNIPGISTTDAKYRRKIFLSINRVAKILRVRNIANF